MNSFKIKITAFLLSIFTLISCELIDVTDVEPVLQISDEKVITNVDQAQSSLYGVYSVIVNGLDYTVNIPAMSSLMGLTMNPGGLGGSSANQFFENDVMADNSYLENTYTRMYFLLNNANHVITKTEVLNTTDLRKNGIIAEAKTLRALTNFYMLRLWGEFYNESSEYGIVLKSEPIVDANPQPRATVAETYKFILEDLDYAIANAPEFSDAFYVSNLFAKALKSKVLLYKKDYGQAAKLALEVLKSDKRELEATFGTIFTKKIMNTKEVLFQTPFNDSNNRNNKAYMFNTFFSISEYYVNFMKGDAREKAAIYYTSSGAARNNKFRGSTFNGVPLMADTEYFLRLDEVYLIYAEAVLRGDNNTAESLWALNKIRSRSLNTPIATINKDELLEIIRKEKLYELGGESGEEWYDLVRFYKEGNLNINDYKTISSDSKLILPLPEKTVRLSDGIVKQNPNY